MTEKPNSVCKWCQQEIKPCWLGHVSHFCEGWLHMSSYHDCEGGLHRAELAEPSASDLILQGHQPGCPHLDYRACTCGAEPSAAPECVTTLGRNGRFCHTHNELFPHAAPQPVAGEGPQEEEVSDVGRLELRNGAVFKCIHEDKTGLRWVRVLDAEQLAAIIEDEIERRLRPFITPACSPTDDELAAVMAYQHQSHTPESRKKLWNEETGPWKEQWRRTAQIVIERFFNVATPPSTGEANGWISVEERLPDDDSDVYAAIAWTHSPGVRKYVIHDCSYYEGGLGSGQKIFTDCEGEEFEEKEVDYWIYKHRLADQLPTPSGAAEMINDLHKLSEAVDLSTTDRKLADAIEFNLPAIRAEIEAKGFSNVVIDGKIFRVCMAQAEPKGETK